MSAFGEKANKKRQFSFILPCLDPLVHILPQYPHSKPIKNTWPMGSKSFYSTSAEVIIFKHRAQTQPFGYFWLEDSQMAFLIISHTTDHWIKSKKNRIGTYGERIFCKRSATIIIQFFTENLFLKKNKYINTTTYTTTIHEDPSLRHLREGQGKTSGIHWDVCLSKVDSSVLFNLSETNIAPENRPPQKESSIPTIHF